MTLLCVFLSSLAMWFLGWFAMWGYIQPTPDKEWKLWLVVAWPITILPMLAYGLGCYIRIRIHTWLDHQA